MCATYIQTHSHKHRRRHIRQTPSAASNKDIELHIRIRRHRRPTPPPPRIARVSSGPFVFIMRNALHTLPLLLLSAQRAALAHEQPARHIPEKHNPRYFIRIGIRYYTHAHISLSHCGAPRFARLRIHTIIYDINIYSHVHTTLYRTICACGARLCVCECVWLCVWGNSALCPFPATKNSSRTRVCVLSRYTNISHLLHACAERTYFLIHRALAHSYIFHTSVIRNFQTDNNNGYG